MTTVIVAEKPSVARDIARVLGVRQQRRGYLQGPGYVVTWALGHLVEFAEPDDYGPPWNRRWSAGQLPMVPDNWKLRTVRQTAAQFAVVKRLLNDAQTTQVVCATDAGREGELIFRLIHAHAGCRKPWQRLWVSSLTEAAIRAGLQRLRAGEDFAALAAAARARAQADWLVGMNLTRAYTVHNRVLCTVGRVQTPTLAMVVRRDAEIAAFRQAVYYELVARLAEGFAARYVADGQTRIDDRAEGERLLERLRAERTGTVRAVDKHVRRNRPPPLYDLTSLQRDANRQYGFTAAQTLQYAQALYEQHKLISYPRTESRHIGDDLVPELPRILAQLAHPLAPAALARLRAGLQLGKAYVDRTRLTDHHAILPTGQSLPARLGLALQRVYGLVVDRFVAVFLPDELVEDTRAELDIGGASFVAQGSVVLDPGWRSAESRRGVADAARPGSRRTGAAGEDVGSVAAPEDPQAQEAQALPPLVPGQVVHVEELSLVEKKTQPPRPYTDATLLAAMRHAGRQVEDEELAAAMKDTGLGTPATRAEIIERLIRSTYIERQGRHLRSTEKGRALIALVAEPLRSPELTGAWERQLKEIEEGALDAADYYQRIVAFVRELVPRVAAGPALTPDQAGAARQQQAGGLHGRRGRAGLRPRKTGVPGETIPAAVAPASMPQPAGLGVCPVCGRGQVVETARAYGCSQYRAGCGLTIWKTIAGRRIPREVAAQLLKERRSGVLDGFRSRAGRSFRARLRLGDDGRVSFEFGSSRRGMHAARGPAAPAAPAVPAAAADAAGATATAPAAPAAAADVAGAPAAAGPPAAGPVPPAGWPPCPKCGRGRIVAGRRGFGCDRYRAGCDFVVWRQVSGKTLTDNQIRTLIEKGCTRLIRGFVAATGEKFAGRLRLDADRRVLVEAASQ